MKKRLLANALPRLWISLTFTMIALAQGGNSIQGRVMLANGSQPSVSVRVKLSLNGMPIYETFTDLSGQFHFTGLGRGVYQLTAESDGQSFETTTVYAEISGGGSAPMSITQNIQLRPKRSQPIIPATTIDLEKLDPTIPAKAKREYTEGIKKSQENSLEEAVKHFREAIKIHPDFYAAHLGLAEAFLRLQRYDDSVDAYQKAIQLKPDHPVAYTGLGATLVKQNKFKEAIVPLSRSIELDRQAAATFMFLGFAEMMTGDYRAAEANLLKAFAIDKSPMARIYLANVYDLRGEPKKAIEQLQAFLKENPQTTNANQIKEAIEKLQKQIADKK